MTVNDMPAQELVANEFNAELSAIIAWWLRHAMDNEYGGVYGEIDDRNRVSPGAEKSAILQARVLWFFSEVLCFQKNEPLREATKNLFEYYVASFVDDKAGGVFWSVKASGESHSQRKQVYAQAFTIYAFCAYTEAFSSQTARDYAIELAQLLEQRAYDHEQGGYIEAFSHDWSPIDDFRLSDRDLNVPKTMNTHLHILEAYTRLHRLIRSDFTKEILQKNIILFTDRFVSPRNAQSLSLFYSMDWQDQCGDISHGHDIEASWLLYEAAETLGDKELLAQAKDNAVTLAQTTLQHALNQDGSLLYERLFATKKTISERHWWPQAEALIGFYNAFQLTGDERFKHASAGIWSFIKTHQIDHENGEWHWLSKADSPLSGPYKIGFWKGPYHNGRAMMEMMKRLEVA